jgi:hypothetical protein
VGDLKDGFDAALRRPYRAMDCGFAVGGGKGKFAVRHPAGLLIIFLHHIISEEEMPEGCRAFPKRDR